MTKTRDPLDFEAPDLDLDGIRADLDGAMFLPAMKARDWVLAGERKKMRCQDPQRQAVPLQTPTRQATLQISRWRFDRPQDVRGP